MASMPQSETDKCVQHEDRQETPLERGRTLEATASIAGGATYPPHNPLPDPTGGPTGTPNGIRLAV